MALAGIENHALKYWEQMISFEYKHAGSVGPTAPEELEIYLDQAGLKRLQSLLMALSEGRTDHQHLFAESWGGSELIDNPVLVDSIPIKHVKIYSVQR